MKATDLMICDWIRLIPQQGYYKNIQWSSLDYHLYCSHEKQPIPLTEDILKANGFKKDTTGYYYFKYGNWWLVFCGRKEYSWLEIRTTKYGGTLLANMRPIKGYEYVHELQHALRLCGLDELADNFKIE